MVPFLMLSRVERTLWRRSKDASLIREEGTRLILRFFCLFLFFEVFH